MRVVSENPPSFASMKLGSHLFYIESTDLRRGVDFNPHRLGGRSSVVFEVRDIAKSVGVLKRKGVRFVVSPTRQFWGGTVAVFCDPDGNEFLLSQN